MKPSDFEKPRCGICGAEQYYIRWKTPKDERRLVCPTCIQERLEHINLLSDKNYGNATQA